MDKAINVIISIIFLVTDNNTKSSKSTISNEKLCKYINSA